MAKGRARWTTQELTARLKNLRLLVFDVDGTLTDGGIVLDGAGGEWKRFDVRDGAGIKLAQRGGLEVALLSGRSAAATAARARDLAVARVVQGAGRKGEALASLLVGAGVAAPEAAYMGDDLLDLPAFRRSGVAACPADAHPAVRAEADYVCESPGGRGAAREWIEVVLTAQGKMGDLLRQFREDGGDA